MRIEDIRPELIDVPSGRRVVDPEFAKALAEDFLATGQEREIDVIEADDRFRLVTGAHRLEAAKIASINIRAKIHDPAAFAGEAAIRLAEISENFKRRELTVLDRAFDVAAWREVYEQAQGAVKRGGDRRSASAKSKGQVDPLIGEDAIDAASEIFSSAFSVAARASLGLDNNAVKRALRIARITQVVRERISLHAIADNQSELLALCAEPAERQARIAGLLTSEPPATHKVADAIAILDRVPREAKPEPWARVSDQFNKLPEAAKRRFITEHWDMIEDMLAEKQAA
ncbi:ParB N-terminal domain-containing protein [Hoeflea alexandrii]|uniref:ParB N-terminal domain-containing protein n=1 Tax=Hoeflea alexandrii TaxID=288436 RepID=UPI0035D0BC77